MNLEERNKTKQKNIYTHTHIYVWKSKKVLVAQLCPTLCNPMDYSLPGSSVHWISQARILEWIAVPISWPRDWAQVSCIAGRFLTIQVIREALKSYIYIYFHLIDNSHSFSPTLYTSSCVYDISDFRFPEWNSVGYKLNHWQTLPR